ncbi:hypothetical protein PVAG01_09049 [Phlyctema vagabunda]|uniref:Uncharacterized protein n=1 Tax=Phlyctema vagabunda TaxID=108571 RepID=A0ABR4P693_9HELO
MYEGRTQYQTRDLVTQVTAESWWVGAMIKSESSKSLEALAAMFFAKAHNLQHISTEALKLYSEALSTLRSMLCDPENVWKFETLASLTTLCMYELVAFRAGQEWNQHARGLARLIELRGPWRHKTLPEKSVFLENRLILLSRAIVSRQTSFLSQKVWKEVPWEDEPLAKQPIDFLLDILCDVTALIHDVDQITSDREETSGLKERITTSFNELNVWWRQWAGDNPTCCKEKVTDSTTMIFDEDGFLFHSNLVYDSFWAAYTVNIHNATRIQLLSLWDMVAKSSTNQIVPTEFTIQEPNITPLLGITHDSQGLAREIFRSLDYCHIESRHHLGTFCLLFPLDFAYSVLGRESREARWLWAVDKAKTNGFKAGAGIMSLLPTYHFDVSRKKARGTTARVQDCDAFARAIEYRRQEARDVIRS